MSIVDYTFDTCPFFLLNDTENIKLFYNANEYYKASKYITFNSLNDYNKETKIYHDSVQIIEDAINSFKRINFERSKNDNEKRKRT